LLFIIITIHYVFLVDSVQSFDVKIPSQKWKSTIKLPSNLKKLPKGKPKGAEFYFLYA